MYEIHPAHSPQASTTNHFDAVQRLHMVGEQGIVVVNFPVTQGIRVRPVDLLVITPTGAHVIQVVRTENKGDLYAPARGAWMVGDTTTPFGDTESNPAQLALKARDLLSNVFAPHGVDGSFLTPMVAINTQWMRLPGDANYINVNGVEVTTLNNLRRVGLPETGHTLGVPEALAILGMIGIPADLVPSEHDFAREGFAMPTEGTFQAPASPYFTGMGAQAPRQPGATGFVRNLLESSGDTTGIQSKWGRRASLGLAALDQAKNLYEGHAERRRAEQAPLAAAPDGTYPQQPYPHPEAQPPYPQQTYPQQPHPQPGTPLPPTSWTPTHAAQSAAAPAPGTAAYGQPAGPATQTPTARKRPMRAWDATITVLTMAFWFLALLAFIVTRYDRGITATVTSYYALALILAGCALPLLYLIQRPRIAQQVLAQQPSGEHHPQQ